MNQFEMIAIIVVAVMLASIIKVKIRDSRRDSTPEVAAETDENRRLRQEVAELKERIHVLERIAVDKENSLAREIEQLRDR